jgi:hypothetical protein
METIMKFSKKMSLALGLSVALVSSVASTSMAADCNNAEIIKTGPNAGVTGGVAIQVQCLDTAPVVFGKIMVVPEASIADQALATALTALSLGKTVWIRTEGVVSGSLLTVIYIAK